MKKFTLFMAGLLMSLLSFGQIQLENTATITRERWRDSVFRMNMQQVPSGILLEYSLTPFDANRFDGLSTDDDTLRRDGDIFQLHSILNSARVNTNVTLVSTDSLYARAFNYNRTAGAIPFTAVYQGYHRIRQNSLSAGLFKIAPDSVGILDVAGRTTSPYDACQFFAAAPFKTTIISFNAITFAFPAALWQMTGITTIAVNFDDGAGFRNVSPNGSVSVNYGSEGVKNITTRITTTGGVLTSHSQVIYKRPAGFSQPAYTWNIAVPALYNNDNEYFAAGGGGGTSLLRDAPAPAITCSGSFWQQLLCSLQPNANVEVENGCDGVFDKPVIIVEGFDPDGSLDIQELKRRFGTGSFKASLKAAGYDLVYVDFTRNGTYIENNAKVLEAVINKVNQTKVGTSKSSIIAYSMGGLIARWCLRDMEDRGLQHQVANYFSYDAPHQGANIPLGLQFFFLELQRDLPYLRFDGDFRKLSDANESEAARQMLVLKAGYKAWPLDQEPRNSVLDPLRAEFAQRLAAKGYPRQTNNYGLAFGRGNNTAGTRNAGVGAQFANFGPGGKLLDASLALTFVSLESSAYAVQENNVNDYITRYRFSGLTFRKIFGIPIVPVITIRARNFKFTGQYPYDDAVGSYALSGYQFANTLNGIRGGSGNTFGHEGHNFIATASALDLQNQSYSAASNWQSNNMFYNIDAQIQNPRTVAGNLLATPSLSPFKAVMTSTSDNPGYNWNLDHNGEMQYMYGDFIVRKILNAVPGYNCTQDGLCGTNPVISSPDAICSTAQASLTGSLDGLVIKWTTTPELSITGGQGTNQVTLSKVSDGVATITATLSNGCGASKVITKQVAAGMPQARVVQTFETKDPETPPPHALLFRADAIHSPGITRYEWFVNGSFYTSGDMLAITLSPCNNKTYRLEVTNACGVSAYNNSVASECGGPGGGGHRFAVFPNPATTQFTVSANSNTVMLNKTAAAKTNGDLRIVLFDQSGKVQSNTVSHTGNNIVVNVQGLKTGQYILQVIQGNKVLDSHHIEVHGSDVKL